MAQSSIMGPPLSPRETRRSGRRSAPSASASTSKSPDSPASELLPRTKEATTRPVPPSNNSSNRTKRLKQEDPEEPVPTKNAQTNGINPSHGNSNGRAKRKANGKEKNITSTDQLIESASNKLSNSHAGSAADPQDHDPEEQGITRCVCGQNEEDADAGEFMVQCETCNVWQHGLCMGYEHEEDLQDEYHCEKCKPERHQDLLRRLAKKPRQSSANSHHTASRLSRSHSPTHLLKPPKRRNTMNSRDAAFDESLKEIIEATAAEFAAATEPLPAQTSGSVNDQAESHEDQDSNSRKKRKRAEDDVLPKKRTRSASSASDHQPEVATTVPEETPAPPAKKAGGGAKSGSRNRRGGGSRKIVVVNQDAVAAAEGEEVAGPSKRPVASLRNKTNPTPKRPPPSSHAGSVPGDPTRRAGGGAALANSENSRAYRNSHAYAVSQQPMFTSWNLPDYLAHLEPMLPTDTPRPLEVRGSAIGSIYRESVDRTMERGVKVKWPSKRMSVGDMNKRVRALVEWVGREQAGATDRGRRRDALEKALRAVEAQASNSNPSLHDDSEVRGGDTMGSPMVLDTTAVIPIDGPSPGDWSSGSASASSTMKMMEELMKELISFQERFGPGVKTRDRERRMVS
ncbi:uncharacterized protein EDB91DRAFT_1196226 [Suillus paluster]|uniref:uncharacterized protein n=1 Tax=Suillus paluster TaxID=48578 RepID=UPI001B87A785|nr:uncharacterized protein EDB91DRAFT_1196226 [Suillus paluster]KAG1751590.1 hypothetical protein EDB91DRAFT_1196226 [Suillus paluster]